MEEGDDELHKQRVIHPSLPNTKCMQITIHGFHYIHSFVDKRSIA
jgi:hypothetical protein